jgi:hypothetical protein
MNSRLQIPAVSGKAAVLILFYVVASNAVMDFTVYLGDCGFRGAIEPVIQQLNTEKNQWLPRLN